MSKTSHEPLEIKSQEELAQAGRISKSDMADQAPENTKAEKPSSSIKESYDDYIKALPPPFWEMKKPPPYPGASGEPPKRPQDRSAEEIAASIKAVCAPITAADRTEDERKRSRSLRERCKDWKEDWKKGSSEVDIRPMQHRSSARLNVWGPPLTDKGRFKRSAMRQMASIG